MCPEKKVFPLKAVLLLDNAPSLKRNWMKLVPDFSVLFRNSSDAFHR
jgi:hypothetical protein